MMKYTVKNRIERQGRTKRSTRRLLLGRSRRGPEEALVSLSLNEATQTVDLEPLIVSLHTWSGDYSQNDPLAEMARKEGWNYIHPDFRGPNRTRDACLSKKAITDIDDAVQYAKDNGNGNVDMNNIFIVGASGGGYATLGSYLKISHQIKAFLSWVPISDLSAWFHQSKNRNANQVRPGHFTMYI